jgi:hypothetical protein
MSVVRVVLVLVLLAAGVAAGFLAADRGKAPSPKPQVVAGAVGVGVGVQMLHIWDEQRAAAYASGSARRLRDLYVPGSSAGAADLRVLRGYRERGLRVTRMRTQVLSLSVLDRRGGWRLLAVTDRLVGAVAVRAGRRVQLPRDRATSHMITIMRGGDGRWRVAEVTDPGSTNHKSRVGQP